MLQRYCFCMPSPLCLDRRLRLLSATVFLFLSGILFVSSTSAQGIDSTLVARFQLADSYFRAGQFDRAILLLEDLYDASPTTNVFYDRLKQSYESIKRYEDAITLVDQRFESLPVPMILADKGRLQYLQGDEEAAFQTWDQAIALLPNRQNTYRVVYISMREVRLFDRGIIVLEQGREALENPTLYQNDLAYLYNITGAPTKAMVEYMSILEANDQQLENIKVNLSRFTDREDALPSYIVVAERAVRQAPLNRSFREILAWLYMESELYEDALNVNKAIDRLEQEEGRVLFTFARSASDAGAYETALQAYQEILTLYPSGFIAPEATFGLGQMYERWAEKIREQAYDRNGNRTPSPNYDQALATYRSFLQNYATHPFYPDVQTRIGRLQQDVFFNLGEAEAILNEVIQSYPDTEAAHEAAYDLGRIEIQRNDLVAARLTFSRLEETLRLGELAERARYEMALLFYYRGEFDAALALLNAINENTGTDIANDAINLKVLLFENRGPDSLDVPLSLYAKADLYKRQRRPDLALGELNTLLQDFGSHALNDDSRYLKAQLLRELGQSEEALALLGELPLMFPMSFLADQSLFLRAQIFEEDLNNPQEALDTYTRLLNDYPGSLLRTETRARIRALRTEGA